MENEKRNYLEVIDSLSEIIGSKNDEEIENAIVDLADIKEYLSGISAEIQGFEKREESQNETIINLRKANNRLMRQIAVTDGEKEKEKEEISRLDILNNIF